MKPTTETLLRDALDACDKSTEFSQGIELEAFLDDELRRYAVYKALENVGEAMNRALSTNPELDRDIPDARQAVNMRNRLIHGYDSLDDRVVWETATADIVSLREQIVAYLTHIEQQG